MSQKAYINKDIYVGNTGKQLKEIETNGDICALNSNKINNMIVGYETFTTTASAVSSSTAERIAYTRTINRGLYLLLCPLNINHYGATGRDLHAYVKLNGTTIHDTDWVINADSWNMTRPIVCLIDVGTDNSTLTISTYGTNSKNYMLSASIGQLLKLKSYDTPGEDMITSDIINHLIELLEEVPTSGYQSRPVVLYDGGKTGTTGDVQLSDDWDKYDYIELFYTRAEYQVSSTKAPITCVNSNGDLPIACHSSFYGYGGGFWIGWKQYLCMNNNKRLIKNNQHGNGYVSGNNQSFKTNTEETIKCLKVLGWKI